MRNLPRWVRQGLVSTVAFRGVPSFSALTPKPSCLLPQMACKESTPTTRTA